MSVQALGWVMDHSSARLTDRLVLLSIANHAAGDPTGDPLAWEAYPGLATIAREAGLGQARAVTEALARLVATGQVVRLLNGAPDERIPTNRRPNLYRIVMAGGRSCGLARCRWCSPGVRENDTPAVGNPGDNAAWGTRKVSPGVRENDTQTVSEPKSKPLRRPAGDDGGSSVAAVLAMAEWKRLEAAGEPEPLCGYPALVARITEALAAGHTAEAVGTALQGMRSYTRHAFDNALRHPAGQLSLVTSPPVIVREACERCHVYPELLTTCPSGADPCPAGLAAG